LEEKRYRNLQDAGDVLQAPRADPIRAFFLFLHLLERQAECIAKLLLAHFKHEPAHAHTTAHIHVNRI
jgi:hypothetical protein